MSSGGWQYVIRPRGGELQLVQNCPMTPPRTTADDLLFDVLKEALKPYGQSAAAILEEWDEDAYMWDFRVVPSRTDSMSVTATFDGQDAVLLVLGRTQVELFPFNEQTLDLVRRLVESAFAGRIEQAGDPRDSYVRVDLSTGPVEMGASHVHVPWDWHEDVQSFSPYGEIETVFNEKEQ